MFFLFLLQTNEKRATCLNWLSRLVNTIRTIISVHYTDTVMVQISLNMGTACLSNDLACISSMKHSSFIPEFVSRLPSITTLAPLTISDLRRILTDVKGSLISQYTALFGYSGVEIRFTSAALDEICKKAAERGGGARGLRGIMVRYMSLCCGQK